MKEVGELIAQLQRLGVRVWPDAGTLRYQGPRDALDPRLLEELRDRKAELIAFCERAAGVCPPQAIEPQQRGGETALPISSAQRRLWLLDRAHGSNPAYNIAQSVRLRGALDAQALRASVHMLLHRHEPLRTALRDDGDEVVQVIAPALALPWQATNLREIEPERRAEAARRHAADLAAEPFDLGRAPLMRAALWTLADDDHVLLLVVHHIVADGRSLEVLAEELGACYAARCAGRPDGLAPLPIQHADVAWHERHAADRGGLKKSLEYWTRRLAGASPASHLPTDRPRPRVPSSAGAVVHRTLDAAFTGRLRRAAREAGATPYQVLVTGVAMLLARYGASDDVVIGCPVTHRHLPELDRLVGFFIDTLALRLDVSDPEGRLSFLELLARTRDTLTQDLKHQRVPFDDVVAAVGTHAGRTPLVQVSVAMLDARRALPSLPGLEVEPFKLGNPSARYDLSVEVHDAGATMDLYWIYAVDLFDDATVQRMAGHFDRLLQAALSEPQRPVATLPMLDDAQRRAALCADAQPPRAGSLADREDFFVHGAFEAQARCTPDAVAVTAGGRHWRYAELDATAERLAHRLQHLGVGPDVRVGVFLDRSFAMVSALLGVLKAGGVYVPFDPDHPSARLAAMIGDARPAVMLTRSALTARLPALDGARLLCVDDEAGEPAQTGRRAVPAVRGHHLAYVLYTSGSTGVPKGVMIPHRAIAHHMHWMARTFPLGPDDAVLQRTPCSFDASVWEFFAPLMAGARLVMAEPGRHADVGYLLDIAREERVTVLQAVPTLLELLVDHPGFLACRCLRRIYSGGETLSAALARRAASGGAEVVNLYGPTEATIDATFCRWDGATDGNVPIGRPIDGMRAYVLDARRQLVPPGVAGELFLAGAGLALGYLNRADLTAERFVPDPFADAAEPDARMYRTGDRVRRLADGQLAMLGRTDRQVKLRGVRIELDEVEAVLAGHPSVAGCAVAVQETPQGPAVVAWVVGDPAPPDADLKAYLRPRLPDAALPAVFVFLPGLPTLPSGKVDRRALAAGPIEVPACVDTCAAPRTPTEAALALLWAELLGCERIGVDADFLDLGGHSLTAVRLVGRVRHDFGVELPAHRLFDGATVASMARDIDEARDAAARQRERTVHVNPDDAYARSERAGARHPVQTPTPQDLA